MLIPIDLEKTSRVGAGWHSVCYSLRSGGASITLFEKAQTGERDCREESVGQISVVLVSAGTKRVKHSERLELPSSALRFAPSSIETFTFGKGCEIPVIKQLTHSSESNPN